jgi:hypothetical protein
MRTILAVGGNCLLISPSNIGLSVHLSFLAWILAMLKPLLNFFWTIAFLLTAEEILLRASLNCIDFSLMIEGLPFCISFEFFGSEICCLFEVVWVFSF